MIQCKIQMGDPECPTQAPHPGSGSTHHDGGVVVRVAVDEAALAQKSRPSHTNQDPEIKHKDL